MTACKAPEGPVAAAAGVALGWVAGSVVEVRVVVERAVGVKGWGVEKVAGWVGAVAVGVVAATGWAGVGAAAAAAIRAVARVAAVAAGWGPRPALARLALRRTLADFG